MTNETSDNSINEIEPAPPVQEQDSKYNEGDILRFVRVRFPGHAKSLSFHIGKRELSYGQKVVAMSDRGLTVGYVNSFPYEMSFQKSMLPIKSINKIATDEDLDKQVESYRKEKEYENLCKDLITKHNLDMNLTHVEFTQFGKKVVFYFTAPARVDFRGLVKDLVSSLKLRIELRQISVRDRAAAVGGIGPCGRQLCCSSFLSKYGSVNIKMAKNQNLTLTYGKLNGVCGQLKCCLQYEDEVYENKRSMLPKEGAFILCKNGDMGKVERLHILSEQFDILTDRGIIKRYAVSEFKDYAPESYQFPRHFEHISNETSTVIGLNEEQTLKSREFEQEIESIKEQGLVTAQNIFEDLFGVETFIEPEEYKAYKEQKELKMKEEKRRAQEKLQKQKSYLDTDYTQSEQTFSETPIQAENAQATEAPPQNEERPQSNEQNQNYKHKNKRRRNHSHRNKRRENTKK